MIKLLILTVMVLITGPINNTSSFGCAQLKIGLGGGGGVPQSVGTFVLCSGRVFFNTDFVNQFLNLNI